MFPAGAGHRVEQDLFAVLADDELITAHPRRAIGHPPRADHADHQHQPEEVAQGDRRFQPGTRGSHFFSSNTNGSFWPALTSAVRPLVLGSWYLAGISGAGSLGAVAGSIASGVA